LSRAGITNFGTKYSHVFIYVCALTWLVYAYHHYLPTLTRPAFKEIFSTVEGALTTAGLVDVLLVAWFWLAAYLLGRKFLWLLGIRLSPGMERMALSSAAGISLLSLIVFLLALLKMLDKWAAWTLLVLPTALWFTELRAAGRESWERATRRIGSMRFTAQWLGHAFILLFLAVVLTLVMVSALGPAIEFDDILYHLTGPKIFVQNHGLKAIPTIPHTFFPKNIEMLFTLGMLLHNEITSKLIHYLLGLLTLLATYAFGSAFFSRNVGWVAMGVVATSPIFLWEMRAAHIDLGFTFYVLVSLYATIAWLRSEEQSWYRIAVFFLAFCLGIKYHGTFVLASLSAVVFLYGVVWSRNLKNAIRATLRFGLTATLGLLPWGVVNAVYTGNPFFPLLNNIFHSPYWTHDHTQMALGELTRSGVKFTTATWWEYLTVFWDMVMDQSDRFRGNIGPFILLLMPFLILKRAIDPRIKLILTFSFFYSLVWVFTGGHGRYYLPALPGLALVAAYGLVSWLEIGKGRTDKLLARITAAVLALMALFNTPFFENYGASSRYGWGIMRTLPLKVLLGQEPEDVYLSRYVKNYPVVQYFNHLPGPKKALYWWNSTIQSMFYLDGEGAHQYSPFGTKLFGNNPDELHLILRENGITHLIVSQLKQEANLLTRPEGDFVRRYLKKVYQRNATLLYAVTPGPVVQDVLYYDFLGHLHQAKIKMPNGPPPGWANSGYRKILAIGEDQRYVLLTFPPAEIEYSLTLPEHPVLKFAVGQMIPRCSGKGLFEVSIVQEDGERCRLYRRELDAEHRPQDVGWFDEEVDLTSHANQRVKVIFKVDFLGGRRCYWYLWADPVIIARP
jgi:4-amino-4-deoxy-L-arabinose transferase-like glycosyltransferase